MKNTVLVVLIAVIVIFLGVSFLLDPLMMKLEKIEDVQNKINKELNKNKENMGKGFNHVNMKISLLDQSLTKKISEKSYPAQAGCGGSAPVDSGKIYDIPVGNSPVLGKKDAPVMITAFFDLQCPFCNRFYPPLKDVVKAYPDKVKVVVKNYPLPFHSNALPAAKLALAANEQGKYFETIEIIMQNGGAVTSDKIKEYAQKVGLNYNQLMGDYKNKDAQWQKQINDDKKLSESVPVHGTPTFYINGRLTMARDLASYKTKIDKILSSNK